MADVSITPLSYSAATVVSNDVVFILAQVDELTDRGIDHTKVLRWKKGQWAHFMIDWPCTHICQDRRGGELALLSLGINAKVHVAQGGDRHAEEIDATADGPLSRGVLRDLTTIDGRPFVAGMQRQVYERVEAGRWQRMDAGMVLPLGSKDIYGLNSIDGFSARDMYAVGLAGEIWNWDGVTWTQAESPTSVALQSVLCAPDGMVYAAGQAGTLLKGRGTAWQQVDLDSFQETLWDLCWFRDKLFAASSRELLSLDNSGVSKVAVPFSRPSTFGHLATNTVPSI